MGLSVRSLDIDAPFCALAGVYRPTTFVSTQSEHRLDDAELRAALLHERAHLQRHDNVLVVFLSFLVDLLPLSVESLVVAYRRARELAADQEAILHTDRVNLASAIIGVANSCSVRFASGLSSEPGIVKVRLETLLREDSKTATPHRRLSVTALLSLLLAGACSIAIANVVIAASCAHFTRM
ncbi:MAG: M56 family metallopeptidase [Vulcanimicrobiaceae bacterium]